MKVFFGGYPLQKYITNLTKTVVEYEDENPDYRCFRNKVHLLNVTKFIFMLNVGLMIMGLGLFFPWSLVALWVPFVYFLFTTYALKQHSTFWMWPAIIIQILLFLAAIANVVILFSVAIFSSQTVLNTVHQGHQQNWFIRVLIILGIKVAAILVCAILFYEFYIFNSCRKYFDDIKDIDLALNKEESTGLRIKTEIYLSDKQLPGGQHRVVNGINLLTTPIKNYTIPQYLNNLLDLEVKPEENIYDYRCIFQTVHVLPLSKIFLLLDLPCWLQFLFLEYPHCLVIIWIPAVGYICGIFALMHKQSAWMWPVLPGIILLFVLNAIPCAIIYYGVIFKVKGNIEFFGVVFMQSWYERSVMSIINDLVMLFIVLFFLYECYVFNICREFFEYLEKRIENETRNEPIYNVVYADRQRFEENIYD